MARKCEENDLHDEAMNRLCFVCTNIITGRQKTVEQNSDFITRALKVPEIEILPGITPLNYCKKCDDALKRVISGRSNISTRQIQVWSKCGENCSSCLLVSKKKFGGRTKKVSSFDFNVHAFYQIRFLSKF